jgi:hypothetical protein
VIEPPNSISHGVVIIIIIITTIGKASIVNEVQGILKNVCALKIDPHLSWVFTEELKPQKDSESASMDYIFQQAKLSHYTLLPILTVL